MVRVVVAAAWSASARTAKRSTHVPLAAVARTVPPLIRHGPEAVTATLAPLAAVAVTVTVRFRASFAVPDVQSCPARRTVIGLAATVSVIVRVAAAPV